MRYIGKQVPKIDGIELVKGTPAYTSDLDINNNALTIKILRSPHPHAEIKNIDTSKAEALAGVECVLTYKNTTDIKFTLAGQSYPEPSPYDRSFLSKTLRYVGDEVAVVAAVDEKTAIKALGLIEVTYKVLEAVLDLDTALDNPVRVHNCDVHTNFDIGSQPERNVASTSYTEYGDIDKELDSSDAVIESTYRTQAQGHCMMETYRATASIDHNGRLQIMSSTQVPFHVRRHLSKILDIPKSKIKIIKPRLGGGFGGKQTASVEMFPAVVTWLTKKPSKIVYTRNETFSTTTSRHAMRLDVRLGAAKDGTIKVMDIHGLADAGAHGEHSPTVFFVVGHKTLPMYSKAKAGRYYGHALYTNKMPGGALRGYGATQGTFAQETAVNELAAKLKIDPAELRLKNLIKQGDKHPKLDGSEPGNPAQLASSTLQQCIKTGKEMIGWDKKYPAVKISSTKVRGYGMAVTMQGSGIAKIDTATVIVKLNDDGYFTLIHSASDMGQGSDTILSQMAAEVLEVDIDKIVNVSDNLDIAPYDPGAYASSGTYVTGNAVIKACEDMRRQILEAGAKFLGTEKDLLSYDGKIITDGDKSLTLDELAARLASFAGKDQLIARGTFGGDTSPPPFMAGFAEVEVDLQTGKCEVTDFVVVADCGTVINKSLARIQVEGGTAMGIGLALYEDVVHSGTGRMVSDSFMTYKIPCRKDIRNIRVAFEESNEPTGPYGAKSIGEVVNNTPAPAIAHAIYNATGVWHRTLPITPEKVLMGMLNK
ncbi:aldehyde oxidase and xanthine dehydrogenase molybdopterin binding protein [Denitrovibrio acetiphilus DSM 12809]|uniref:Aldehyde oxidase and xanthine dehydrogenase molybdopterin binding protein n=1 Tax=Denitrovibrio acetiphilus (strain DSM 12809 / NBRC 114555 / N2460) TaxID=522772 RepID=D4H1W2_DENA2|nr:molybdopterin cofactor-binding domain-containing protein [Denitrovibrio acetiphilus]ADD66939.1 aldehyde oxidase and xanthine dehydrogenase molybdopterin binding protein [Denitrovibrio acetiphilus DSM 12809]